MEDAKRKKVIISLDLSTEEFIEIPLPPPDVKYKHNEEHRLGVIYEECLCIYSSWSPLSKKKWVMKNKWELYNNDDRESKFDVAHCLTKVVDHRTPHTQKTSYFYSHDGGKRVSIAGDYIRASIFVKSVVSPHPHPLPRVNNNKNERLKMNFKEGNGSVESASKGSIRKRKRKRKRKGNSKTSCKS